MTPPCVCSHESFDHYRGPCDGGDCGCSFFTPDNGERETEAAGGRLPDPYCGIYGKRYTLTDKETA